MATLIICPACGTRYETKAVFPPEGRKVRCSKCAHVWQAQPVTAPAPQPAMTPQPPQPPIAPQAAPPPAPPVMPQVAPPPVMPQAAPPPPQPSSPVNAGMRGFAGIAPSTQSAPALTQDAVEADLAAQVARINAEAMAEVAPPIPEPEKRGGGIFGRLSRKGAASTSPSDAAMDEGPIADSLERPAMTDASFGDASFGDASFDDGGMDIDPALAAQAFGEDKPARKERSVVAIGWLVLALFVASIVGFLAFAPSTVMSVLPGASRLYALFGTPAGAHGLSFQGVRYGWTSDGSQTVLEVQGDVVNLSSASLDVPTVVIALRDEKGEEISAWTTEIGEEALGAGEHAPFLRQIPSPPSNVHSVKVHFAKAE